MQKDFDKWNRRKKLLNETVFNSYVHSKEIWWCAIGANIGDEEDGKSTLFERPVLVIKKFNQKIVLVVPLTTKPKDNFYYFNFVHDGIEFAAMLSQIRLISTSRLYRRIRMIDQNIFDDIRQAIIKRVI